MEEHLPLLILFKGEVRLSIARGWGPSFSFPLKLSPGWEKGAADLSGARFSHSKFFKLGTVAEMGSACPSRGVIPRSAFGSETSVLFIQVVPTEFGGRQAWDGRDWCIVVPTAVREGFYI